MASALASAAETLRDSVSLGRRSLPRVGWVLAATALCDFAVRWIVAATPINEATALDPAHALAGLVAAELTLVDAAVLAMVSLLLLPIQDGLIRGRPVGVARASSSLVRKTFPLTVTGVVQGVVLLGPPMAFLYAAVAPVLRPIAESGGVSDPGILMALIRAAAWRAFWPSLAWIVAISLIFLFAFPFLILEDRGPIRSIGLSVSLFVRGLAGNWSRILATLALWGCLFLIVWAPLSPIRALAAALPGGARVGALVAATWSVVTTALALVWCDAGLVTLFRRLHPAAS